MMERRRALLDDFKPSATDHTRIAYSELCFKILYGLPAHLQIELATLLMRRYLPIFEFRWPNVTWPREIFNDVAQWGSTHGRSIPDDPRPLNAADAAFSFSFDGLLLAYAYQNDEFVLTSSSVCAIHSAINARRTNSWIADDPEAYQMWKKRQYIPGRRAVDNLAAQVVTEREWKVVTKWLRQEKVWTYPDEGDIEKIEQELGRWKQHQMLLIVPEIEVWKTQRTELKAAA